MAGDCVNIDNVRKSAFVMIKRRQSGIFFLLSLLMTCLPGHAFAHSASVERAAEPQKEQQKKKDKPEVLPPKYAPGVREKINSDKYSDLRKSHEESRRNNREMADKYSALLVQDINNKDYDKALRRVSRVQSEIYGRNDPKKLARTPKQFIDRIKNCKGEVANIPETEMAILTWKCADVTYNSFMRWIKDTPFLVVDSFISSTMNPEELQALNPYIPDYSSTKPHPEEQWSLMRKFVDAFLNSDLNSIKYLLHGDLLVTTSRRHSKYPVSIYEYDTVGFDDLIKQAEGIHNRFGELRLDECEFNVRIRYCTLTTEDTLVKFILFMNMHEDKIGDIDFLYIDLKMTKQDMEDHL